MNSLIHWHNPLFIPNICASPVLLMLVIMAIGVILFSIFTAWYLYTTSRKDEKGIERGSQALFRVLRLTLYAGLALFCLIMGAIALLNNDYLNINNSAVSILTTDNGFGSHFQTADFYEKGYPHIIKLKTATLKMPISNTVEASSKNTFDSKTTIATINPQSKKLTLTTTGRMAKPMIDKALAIIKAKKLTLADCPVSVKAKVFNGQPYQLTMTLQTSPTDTYTITSSLRSDKTDQPTNSHVIKVAPAAKTVH